MREEGYTSGELHDNIFMNDDDIEDGSEGIDYTGWWSIKPVQEKTEENNFKTMFTDGFEIKFVPNPLMDKSFAVLFVHPDNIKNNK